MAKMDYKMVALCAAAVGVIYSTGYFVTEPQAVMGAQSTAPTSIVSSSTNNSSTAASSSQNNSVSSVASSQVIKSSSTSTTSNTTAKPKAVASSTTNSSTQKTTTSSTPKSLYKDGTYYGEGYNRIGGIQVAVTITQGKIASAEITQCTTHYRQSAIDPALPNQVVARQSANIDFVSGATKSSQDFQNAVAQALQQAMS